MTHVQQRFPTLSAPLGALVATVCALAPLAAGASGPPPAVPAQAASRSTAANPEESIYRPPLHGAPETRVTGGTRGEGCGFVTVLAPEQTGLTVSEQPTLYWYLGQPERPSECRVEVTLIDDHGIEPLLEVDLGPTAEAGVHALELGDHRVRLEPGEEYRWSVALVANPEERSSDSVASGTIQRVAPPGAPSIAVPTGGDPVERVYALAGQGIWYDALDEASELIAANPTDRRYRRLRAALLEGEGVDLPEVAAYDLARAR
jgi:uncharacterized protein DUF928